MNTESSLFYDEYNSFDYPRKILPKKPLKEVEKNIASREFYNEKNEH